MKEKKGLRKDCKIYTFDALTWIAMKLNVIDIFYFEFPRHCIPITNSNEVDNELKKKNITLFYQHVLIQNQHIEDGLRVPKFECLTDNLFCWNIFECIIKYWFK